MNGIHDMGGMDGFGPVAVEDDEAFHEDWERTVYAMVKLLGTQGSFSTHQMRFAVERIDPAEYLTASYFERWLAALETVLVENGLVTAAELRRALDASGPWPAAPVSERDDPDSKREDDELVELVHEQFRADSLVDRPGGTPEFEVGDAVRVRNDHPEVHTRCPRYVRRAEGAIEAIRGSFDLPDADVVGRTRVEPVYSVRIEAVELWGADGRESDSLVIDLYESYLEPSNRDEASN